MLRGHVDHGPAAMTAMTPHIHVLRAEAAVFADISRTTRTTSVAHMLMALADAKSRAADALEAEEQALEQRLAGPQQKGH